MITVTRSDWVGYAKFRLAPYPRNDGLGKIRTWPLADSVTEDERYALALRDQQEAVAGRGCADWRCSNTGRRLVQLTTCAVCASWTPNVGHDALCSWPCAQDYAAQMALNGYRAEGTWVHTMRYMAPVPTKDRLNPFMNLCAYSACVCLGNVNFYEVGI